MRHFDLTPLYRSTIGFDRLGALLDTLGAFEGDTPSYPPYNIERGDENEYRISMAVAGFGEKDPNIEVKENTLSIRGEKQTELEETTYLHRIAGRSFERRFPARRRRRGQGREPRERSCLRHEAAHHSDRDQPTSRRSLTARLLPKRFVPETVVMRGPNPGVHAVATPQV